MEVCQIRTEMTTRRFPTERLIWQYTAEVHTAKGMVVIAQTKWSTDQRKPHAELIQQLIADGWQPSGTDRLGLISVLKRESPSKSAPDSADPTALLKHLIALRNAGVLTEDEIATIKARIVAKV
jgi:hypothetical protein